MSNVKIAVECRYYQSCNSRGNGCQPLRTLVLWRSHLMRPGSVWKCDVNLQFTYCSSVRIMTPSSLNRYWQSIHQRAEEPDSMEIEITTQLVLRSGRRGWQPIIVEWPPLSDILLRETSISTDGNARYRCQPGVSSTCKTWCINASCMVKIGGSKKSKLSKKT